MVDALLGGWQLGGIFTMQSGFPFTVLCGPGNIQNGGGVCYPDSTGQSTGSCRASERTRTRYFNTDAFVDRTNPDGPFRYGTVPRNSLIGPGIVSLDASANKRFSLGGSKVIEVRIEVFNLPNRRSGTSPGTSCARPPSASSPAPGSTRGKSRSAGSWCSDWAIRLTAENAEFAETCLHR